MSAFSFVLEAIESRAASTICPKGTSNQLHSLHRRRCFHHGQRQGSAAVEQIGWQEHVPRPDLLPPLSTVPDTSRTLERESIQQANMPPNFEYPPEMYGRNRFNARRRERRRGISNKVPGVLAYDSREDVMSRYRESLKSPNTALYDSLRIGDPRSVLRSLIRLTLESNNAGFRTVLSDVPATTFSEVLRFLDPDYFVGQFQQIYKNVSDKAAEFLNLPQSSHKTYYMFCNLFLAEVNNIMNARRAAAPLTLNDLKYLLKCARATGSLKTAQSIWLLLTGTGRGYLKPDLDCYNHLLAVKCWSETMTPYTRYRLRVVPWNYSPRNWLQPPSELQGQQVGNQSIKSEIVDLFREMVSSGVTGNEETFCYMMIAFGREGDLPSLESLLKRIWDIDVAELLAPGDLEHPARSYPRDSPFFPSSQLLYTIAHAYGTNNAVPTALQLIDYVSRQYSITIDHEVWMELLEWTYVLSKKRVRNPRMELPDVDPETGEQRMVSIDDRSRDGQLPRAALTNLWTTMISEPYNIRPSVQMFDRPVMNFIWGQSFQKAQELMNDAGKYHKHDVLELGRLKDEVDQTFFKTGSGEVLENKTRQLHFQHLRVRQNRLLIRKWVRQLLAAGNKNLNKKHFMDWWACNIPNIVLKWKPYLPNRITYPTKTGRVTFWTGAVNFNRWKQWKLRYGNQQAKRYRILRRVRLYRHANLQWNSYQRRPLNTKRLMKGRRTGNGQTAPPTLERLARIAQNG